MSETPWIIISIGVLIILLAIVALFVKKTQKGKQRPTDYYTFFIIGIIWIAIGFPLDNYALSIIGLIFTIWGLAHKSEWKKNHEACKWENLSKQERKFKIWLIVGLGILLLIGLIAFLITYLRVTG